MTSLHARVMLTSFLALGSSEPKSRTRRTDLIRRDTSTKLLGVKKQLQVAARLPASTGKRRRSIQIALQGISSSLHGSSASIQAVSAKARNLKFLAAGAIAGVVSRTLVSPLEVVATINMATVGSVEGPWETLTRLWRVEGINGLYKGNGANCLKVAPTKGIQFVSFEFLKRQILTYKHWQNMPEVIEPIERLIAGGFASFRANSHCSTRPPIYVGRNGGSSLCLPAGDRQISTNN